jgi:lipoate-protein ligase A
VQAAVARHDGSATAGPVCFASQQGADLRVGERKLCGSAQARTAGSVPERRTGSVLQHGSILLTRLPFDETDLVHPAPGEVLADRAELRQRTVTLDELGVDPDARRVADALVEGFRASLDVEFTASPRAVV